METLHHTQTVLFDGVIPLEIPVAVSHAHLGGSG